MRSVALCSLLIVASCHRVADDRTPDDPPTPTVIAPPPDAAPCYRYVPRDFRQHAGQCFATAELACGDQCGVHICGPLDETARDNALANPHAFGGEVVPIRAPGQLGGLLVSCHGW